MNRAPYALFALAVIAFVLGVSQIATRELASGGAYPAYSSLRASPDGGKLLYDALSRVPGLQVSRSLAPLAAVSEKDAAILLVGEHPQSLGVAEDDLRALEDIARAGNRVVIAFEYQRSLMPLQMPAAERRLDLHFETDSSAHPFFFRPRPAWTPLRQAGTKTLALQRSVGRGSLVLLAESGAFANDAVLAGTDRDLIAAAIGDCRRVVFEETHFGIAESGSVVGLARQFHLMGFVAGLGVCAALFLWKSIPAFPPPIPPANSLRTAMTAQAGLGTLLRRHIPSSQLAATCWRAWLETSRGSVTPARIQKVEAILEEAAAPADALRRIAQVLHSKGEL